MSRVGNNPIRLPKGVETQISGRVVTIKGPRGTLSRELHPAMTVRQEDGTLVVSRPSDQRQHRALHGLTRALLNNMVVGASEGFQRTLELVGVGYRAQQQGQKVSLAVGFSHPVEVEPMPGVTLSVEGNNRIHVNGIDKELVGEMAARIRTIRRPNRYTGKGIRYTGEQVRLKPGKTAGRKK